EEVADCIGLFQWRLGLPGLSQQFVEVPESDAITHEMRQILQVVLQEIRRILRPVLSWPLLPALRQMTALELPQVLRQVKTAMNLCQVSRIMCKAWWMKISSFINIQ